MGLRGLTINHYLGKLDRTLPSHLKFHIKYTLSCSAIYVKQCYCGFIFAIFFYFHNFSSEYISIITHI